jgi:transcriptional regulator with XRE-family HTH domain
VGPFGETVLAWRLARRMTQAGLAQAARIPRPNLSAIERGDREVTLKTLRALALALDLRPGVLADGVMPAGAPKAMSRESLERVARAAATGTDLGRPQEAGLSRQLGATLSARRGLASPRRGPRSRDRTYFLLRTAQSPETLASLFARATEKLERP